MKPLPKQYDHKETEARLQKQWEEKRIYAWDETQPRENTYVIDTPPPTVSGTLHMGHIFSYTQADFVARYQRMKGKTVFYPMGFDDNGLPTERLVEKTRKIRAADMSREEFIKLCEGVAEEARIEFRNLFTSVALSVDWAQEYHTISDEARRISQLSFLDLFRKGQVYRKLQPMLWDPVDQTAIAQAEVVDREMESSFNDILFGVEGSGEKLTIATTRPELIPACVGVFYHPEDERYRHLRGKQAVTPLFGVKVPILEDESVEMEKGTGIMMCCTFGDEADIAKWEKHTLETRVVLNKYGKMDFSSLENRHSGQAQREPESQNSSFRWNDDLVGALQNLKASNPDPKHPGARQKILEMLAAEGLLKESKKITHAVKCAERSGAPLEILPTFQWFVKVLDKKDALKEKAAECNWHPEYMKIRMDQWIDGLKWDWCISRQRYFGVPFPVWYSKRKGEEGKILIAEPGQLPANPLKDLPKGYTRDEVEAEPDVMDTWATSSISPQLSSRGITRYPLLQGEKENRHSSESCNLKIPASAGMTASAGMAEDGESPRFARDDEFVLDPSRHAKLFPADLRPQAHEIIRTWAFYTLVKAHLHENTIPWKNLMISGWCLASDKTKMSKSKGNVVTPVELIVDKGADVVRYWASTSRLGADTAFSEDVLKIGKKLVTKLWNATQFAALHLDKLPQRPKSLREDFLPPSAITETLDKWILSRCHYAVHMATECFEKYEYAEAREFIDSFFWNDFCDNYLELVKGRAYNEDGKNNTGQQSALHALYHCLNALLKLYAPYIPHITEELYSHLFEQEYAERGSIHGRGQWPESVIYLEKNSLPDENRAGSLAVSLLGVIRKAKSERNVSIKFPLDAVIVRATGKETPYGDSDLAPVLEDLKAAANAAALRWENSPAPAAGTVASDDGFFLIEAWFSEQSDIA